MRGTSPSQDARVIGSVPGKYIIAPSSSTPETAESMASFASSSPWSLLW